MYASLQEFEKVLKQKQVELELLEVKLAQKSLAVTQEREKKVLTTMCKCHYTMSTDDHSY